MNWKLLGACSALSLLMFADADAMGFGRRADKADAAGLGHSAASVRAYGVAKAAKKTYLAESKDVGHMSTKDFIELSRGKKSIDGEASIDTGALREKYDKLVEQEAGLDAEIKADDEEIEKIEGELKALIAGNEFKSLGGEDVGVTIDPGEVDVASNKFGFDSLFRSLRGEDGSPCISSTDRGFNLENARGLWNRLCELRADVETKSAKMRSLEVESDHLKTELAIRDFEAKVRKAKESGGETSDDEDFKKDDSDSI